MLNELPKELKLHDIAVKILGLLVVEFEPVLVVLGANLHCRVDGSAIIASCLELLDGMGRHGKAHGRAIGTGRTLVVFLLLLSVHIFIGG
jgi:hypothetical protein